MNFAVATRGVVPGTGKCQKNKVENTPSFIELSKNPLLSESWD